MQADCCHARRMLQPRHLLAGACGVPNHGVHVADKQQAAILGQLVVPKQAAACAGGGGGGERWGVVALQRVQWVS